MSLEAEFLQGPENSFPAPMGAADLSAGDLVIIDSNVLVLAIDDATRLCEGAIHENATGSQSAKVQVDAFVPGSIWLFACATAFASVGIGDSISPAGSSAGVDVADASDACMGRRVFHDREVDESYIAVRIEPHVYGDVA